MHIKPEFQIQDAPIPIWQTDSREEADVAESAIDLLRLIRTSATEVLAGIALYENCAPHVGERDLRWDWAFMGARAGAFGLRNFGYALAKLRRLVGMVGSWRETDFGPLRAIEADFQRLFPGADKLRHSVAHPELYADPKKEMNAGAPIEELGVQLGPATVVQGSIFSGTFVATFEGQTLRYALNTETCLALRQLTDRIWEVFGPLDWAWNARRERPPQ